MECMHGFGAQISIGLQFVTGFGPFTTVCRVWRLTSRIKDALQPLVACRLPPTSTHCLLMRLVTAIPASAHASDEPSGSSGRQFVSQSARQLLRVGHTRPGIPRRPQLRPCATVAPGAAASEVVSADNGDGNPRQLRDWREVAYLSGRAQVVSRHFPSSLGIDDFLNRLEVGWRGRFGEGARQRPWRWRQRLACSCPSPSPWASAPGLPAAAQPSCKCNVASWHAGGIVCIWVPWRQLHR